MRRKPLPPPPDELASIGEAHGAVPLVASTEEDCCARLQDRLGLPGRDTAATWLDFLRGLGLAEEGASGFSRVRADPDRDELAERFLQAVYGAQEALEALRAADGPLGAEAVAERTEALVSPWERQRDGPDWPAVHAERTADLLDWLVLLGLAEARPEGYRPPATD